MARGKLGYIPDFNEKCPNVEYYLAFLRQLKERMPGRIQTDRVRGTANVARFENHLENRMHEAAKLCPVVIDESLIDVDSLLLARRMG